MPKCESFAIAKNKIVTLRLAELHSKRDSINRELQRKEFEKNNLKSVGAYFGHVTDDIERNKNKLFDVELAIKLNNSLL